MNRKAFVAMLARDAHVARRNFVPLMLQTFLQPLMFVFVFGRVMVGSGYMPPEYKSLLLPGIMALSMVSAGIWSVAMPLIAEFQFTHEIEDRLLAPMDISWLAVEKVVAGMLQALAAGLTVIPAGWLLLRPGVELSLQTPFSFVLVAVLLFSPIGRLGVGLQCRSGPGGINVQHGGGTDDFLRLHLLPWSALANFPILQKAVLLNPMVYASEGLRGTRPQFPHLSLLAVMAGLASFNILFLVLGLRQFHRKAID